MQIKIVVLLSLGAVFVVINWVTTQHAARLFGYSPALGQPWCDFPLVGSLYRPWNWMVWWSRWHSDPTLAPLWDLCAREAVYPMVALTAIAMGAIAIARHGWFAESIRSAWISALGQHQGSSSGRTHRQTPVSAAEASQDRRARETSKTLRAPRWRLSGRLARWGRLLSSAIAVPRTSWSSRQRGAARASGS